MFITIVNNNIRKYEVLMHKQDIDSISRVIEIPNPNDKFYIRHGSYNKM